MLSVEMGTPGMLIEGENRALHTVEPGRPLPRRALAHPLIELFKLGFSALREFDAEFHVCDAVK